MSATVDLEHSGFFPVPVEHAYATVIRAPLEEIFRRRFWAIPPIVAVRDQVGQWGTPGQTRTIVMADRGTLQEKLTHAEPPHAFGYDLSKVRGPMKPLVSTVLGRWTFTPEAGGTRINWHWTVQPRSSAAALAMPMFGWLWRGNARQGFEELGTILRVG